MLCKIFKTLPIMNGHLYVITFFVTFTYLVEHKRWQPWKKSIILILEHLLSVLGSDFLYYRLLQGRYFTPKSSYKIVCSCVYIVCSSSKTNEDPFTFELEHRNRLKLFVVSRKPTWRYFTPKTAFSGSANF